LIFDNADDPSIDLSAYFPVGSRGTILITTRNPECKVHQTVGSYEFAGMGTEDAVDLLLKSIGTYDLSLSASRHDVKTITTTLGNLALAIVQAGAAIGQGLCSIEGYCEMYQRRRRELLSRAPTQASSDYKYTVYTTWEVSVNLIESMGSEAAGHALELLRLFSFLHFDGISEQIFEEAWVNMAYKSCSDWSASNQVQWIFNNTSTTWDPYSLRESIILLTSFSLIRVHGLTNNLSIHPLVHTWARDRLDEAEQKRWVLKTAVLLADSISWDQSISGYDFRRSLVAHVTTCLQAMTLETLFASGMGEAERCGIASRFALVLRESGQWQGAMLLEEKLYEARKRTLGDEHPDTLISIGNLARSYSDLGRVQDAVQLKEKVYEARKRTLGDEHPDTLISMGNLAKSYSDLGRVQDSVLLEEKVYEASKRTLGDEHPSTLISMGNLARSYSDLGRVQDAVQLEEKAYEARKRTLGDEHPDTLLSMVNLASSYSDLGRVQDAVQLEEKAYEASKRTLGEEHPDTLLSMGNLAKSYSDLGRAQDAVQLIGELYEARKRTLGEEHPTTLSILEFYNSALQKLHEETQPENTTQSSSVHSMERSTEKIKGRRILKSFFKRNH
jgi:tetratricopeptide (TPR) repeat protein